MSNVIRPVIIAGGVGSRLWPLSREHNPKQFISLFRGEINVANDTGSYR
ncbi:sugar phosphate nucleotidyltransferase [Cobetia marina]